MIRLSHHTAFGLPASRVWFADRPARLDALSLTIYHAAADVGPLTGFSHEPGHTLLIDLDKSEAEFLRSYRNSHSDQIRRARRDGLSLRFGIPVEDFVTPFNDFARARGLGPLRAATLAGYGEACVATEVIDANGRPLNRHLLLLDHASGRVRMYKGCPIAEPTDPEDRKLIGRANKCLHHLEMLQFRALGFATYDMGGFALDTTDPVLSGINRFKLGFGGEVVAEARYLPLPMALWSRAAKWRRRRRERSSQTERATPETA